MNRATSTASRRTCRTTRPSSSGEVTLTGQPYALDTDKSVDQVLKAAKAEVVSMHRIAVGEGIEKVVEDYAAEVAKAMQV